MKPRVEGIPGFTSHEGLVRILQAQRLQDCCNQESPLPHFHSISNMLLYIYIYIFFTFEIPVVRHGIPSV